ncbi:MAG: multiheme c-type cytochrome, partial [Planctomycetota bacterium]
MRSVLLFASASAILVSLALLPARAQDSGRSTREELHFGAGSCAAQACHGGAFPDRVEYKVWATEDKHSKAFEVLTGPLGQRMGVRLGIEPTEAKECLSCHGTTGVELAETFDMADGVSCELCHGGARGWLGPHAAPEWQNLSIAQKEERGLRDLSTPAKRAQTCVRCHVGGDSSDITHAIMAAGHPPLHFDAATYLRVMPPHWKDEEDLSVPTWLESGKANAVAQLKRIARWAATPKGWPEFAVFDCES